MKLVKGVYYMYNLLISFKDGVWEEGSFELELSRFLEYTIPEISEKLETLTQSNVKFLMSLPCLFAYEGEEKPYRVGTITKIKKRDTKIYIEFDLDKAVDPIPYDKIKSISKTLDIRDWEVNRTHWAVKDENLVEILERIGVEISTPQSAENRALEAKTKPTNNVNTVKGFITKIFDTKEKENYEVYYRGHGDKNKYKLEPSLFRKDDLGNYLFLENEHILYRELLVSDSRDFERDNYTIDKLVRMQHFSLPTRMLDITSNPLISLYFACSSDKNIDGEVLIFKIKKDLIKYFDSDAASCIANLARLSSEDKNSIDYTVSESDFNKQVPIEKLLHLIREEKPYFQPKINPLDLKKIICIKSKMSNARILSQSGAFLLFGHEAIMSEDGVEGIEIERITIKSKENILAQLDKLNINESTVFPYIENSAKYIREKFKAKF